MVRQSGQPQDALAWYEKALGRLQNVLSKQPKNAFARLCVREFSAGKAVALVRVGRRAEAAALAATLADDKELAGEALYSTACALAAGSAGDGPDAGALAERAVALLRRARATGYFKDPATLTQLETEKDLEPLRPRDDFKKLLQELKAKAPKPK
jgi:hypothetical protein